MSPVQAPEQQVRRYRSVTGWIVVALGGAMILGVSAALSFVYDFRFEAASIPAFLAGCILSVWTAVRWRQWRAVPMALVFALVSVRNALYLAVKHGHIAQGTPLARLDGVLLSLLVPLALLVVGILWRVFANSARTKQADESLRFQAMLLDQIGDRVVAADLDGRITYVNRAMARAQGLAREELLGQSVEAFGGNIYRGPTQRDILAKTLADGKWQGEVLLHEHDGPKSLVDLRTCVIRDEKGQPTAVCAVADDITDQRALEEQLRHSQKMEAVGKLAGGIAHDFNNLLTAIIGYANLIRAEAGGDGRAREAAEVIETAATRGAELTGQLLGFARKGKYQLAPVNLRKAIQEVIRLVSAALDKRIRIVERLDASDPVVLGDPGQMQQVFLNLLVNAQDAMPTGGVLTIATEWVDPDMLSGRPDPGRHAGRYVKVAVSDTGPGVPADIRDHIFEPFVTTKPAGEGTGMGLAMVYGIVESHGGWVDLDSVEGHGATFSVYLPVTDELEGVEPVSVAPKQGSARILVVDDELVVRRTVAAMLQSLGYQVVALSNGQEAADYYRRHGDAIDLAIIDLVMPQISGRECFETLRRIDPEVKALFSTGYGPDEGPAEVLGSRAAFLRKPFDLAELSNAVSTALSA